MFFYFDVGISPIFDEFLLLGKIIFPTSDKPKWFRRMGEPNGDFFMAIYTAPIFAVSTVGPILSYIYVRNPRNWWFDVIPIVNIFPTYKHA